MIKAKIVQCKHKTCDSANRVSMSLSQAVVHHRCQQSHRQDPVEWEPDQLSLTHNPTL